MVDNRKSEGKGEGRDVLDKYEDKSEGRGDGG